MKAKQSTSIYIKFMSVEILLNYETSYPQSYIKGSSLILHLTPSLHFENERQQEVLLYLSNEIFSIYSLA